VVRIAADLHRHPAQPAPAPGARIAGLDDLKVVLVASIIVGHAFITYGDIGSWPYREPSASEPFLAVAEFVVTVGGLFVMGLFFLIAGWFSPASLRSKGTRRFVRDRLVRLGVPFVAYVLVVHPLVVWMGNASTGSLSSAFGSLLPALDPGPLWFAGVLLVFSLGYAALRVIAPSPQVRTTPLEASHVAGVAALIAIGTFLVRLQFTVDSYQVFAAHVWQWPQCLGLFGLGVVARERSWLDPVPPRIRRAAAAGVVVACAAFVVAFLAVGDATDPFAGGWHWQAAVGATMEGVASVGLALVLFERFRARPVRAGALAAGAGRAAFGAYVLQAPVLVGLAVLLGSVALAPELKFAVVAPMGVITCFGAAWVLSRVPGVRRVI
jgi:fucose 4-O-acetylase-like acetyltransferase